MLLMPKAVCAGVLASALVAPAADPRRALVVRPPRQRTTRSAAARSRLDHPRPPRRAATGPGALSAEAQSAATGDIPDNQVFLVFNNAQAAGYSIKYPEGWTQTAARAGNVTFHDKNNLVHVVDRARAPRRRRRRSQRS